MLIELNFKSGKPAYLQIMEQVKFAAAMGELRAGDVLPSIRALAERLRINRNTVAKAYSQLEHEGVVEMVQGKGVFLKDEGSPYGEEVKKTILEGALDTAIVSAHHLKVSREKLLELFNKRLDEFERRRDKNE